MHETIRRSEANIRPPLIQLPSHVNAQQSDHRAKYGGVCSETPEKIRAVARSLADLHSRGHRVVAIVSAMGKTTDELIKAAYQVSPHPNRRELDMLLTTGERISMSLMSMALSDLGAPAISFTGVRPV